MSYENYSELLIPEPAKKRSITLEDRFWTAAKQIGAGNASLGLRRALAQCVKATTSASEKTLHPAVENQESRDPKARQ
jgi:hypothetical protein